MILVLEPEKLTAKLILGIIVIISLVGAVFAVDYWKNKLTEFSTQQAENIKLKTDLDTQKELVAKLTNDLDSKESQVLNISNSVTQLREKNKNLGLALTQCQATLNSQKSTIKTYKDYYYYYLSNGK